MVAPNPDYAPVKSTSRSENRVGDFFVRGGDRVGADQPAGRIVIGEKYDAASRMASGHSKFANGAVTAAMVHLFNKEGDALKKMVRSDTTMSRVLRVKYRLDEAPPNLQSVKLPKGVEMVGEAGELVVDVDKIMKNPIPVFEIEYGERVIASTMVPLDDVMSHPVLVKDKLVFEFVPMGGGLNNNIGHMTIHGATGAIQEIMPYNLDSDFLRVLDYGGVDLNKVDTIYLFNRTRDLDYSRRN